MECIYFEIKPKIEKRNPRTCVHSIVHYKNNPKTRNQTKNHKHFFASSHSHSHHCFKYPKTMAIKAHTLFSTVLESTLPLIASLLLLLMLLAGTLVIVTCYRLIQRFQHQSFLTSISLDDVESQSTMVEASHVHACGLEKSVINAIPSFIYNTGKSKQDESNHECTICLVEFENNDYIRTLPLCSHIFHLVCIDAWLHKKPNCPLCRSCLRCDQFDKSPFKPIMADRIHPSFHDHMPFQISHSHSAIQSVMEITFYSNNDDDNQSLGSGAPVFGARMQVP